MENEIDGSELACRYVLVPIGTVNTVNVTSARGDDTSALPNKHGVDPTQEINFKTGITVSETVITGDDRTLEDKDHTSVCTRAPSGCVNLKPSGSPHALNSTNDALDPRELARIFTDRMFDFVAVFIPPDPILLRGQAVEVSI